MANFLSNPLVILFAAAVIIVSLMFLFVGRKKKDKKKKVEKAIQPKTTEEKPQESNSEMPSEQKQSEEKVQVSDDFIENPEANSGNSNEKRVSKVYIRKSKESSNLQEDENLEEKKYNDLSDKAEFVKTSKTISS